MLSTETRAVFVVGQRHNYLSCDYRPPLLPQPSHQVINF
jgi:hypothetical protein